MSDNLGTPIGRSWSSHAGTVNDSGIVCDRLIRINPPIYECRCGTCGTSFQVGHQRFPNTQCPNALAHGRADRSRSQTTITISPTTATRSRDAQSARDYTRQEAPQSVRYSFRGEPDFSNMSPEQLSSYLTNVEGR
jgi:hypothetical protein